MFTINRPTVFSLRVLFAVAIFLLSAWCLSPTVQCQSTTATLSGTVEDERGAVIPGASVIAINTGTRLERRATTNVEGYFVITLLPPSSYVVRVENQGFAPVEVQNVVLNVGDQKALQIQLKAGDVNATVDVQSDAQLVNESPAVATVVDRQLAANIPLNGRSFQSLIQLTPGVVLTANNGIDTGQFSINGQRANANYWTVDGVSANIGISATAVAGSGTAGTLGSTSVFGGTNSLVSVDALQEFRIQTSTYAPEFGRLPGGQISILTRSGTNGFHGTAFEYFRNDRLNANNWFANSVGLARPKERQNDFGGVFNGPIRKNKTFFFFSYEGLRLRLPQTALSLVPDLAARTAATPVMQPYLKAFPLPNGPDDLANGVAQFNATYSDPGTLDAYSIRVDHKLSDRLSLFGRYNYSPSEIIQRGGSSESLSTLAPTTTNTRTGTLGLTWAISTAAANDFRFNYSRTEASRSNRLDSFGGAVPLGTLPLPSPFTAANGSLTFSLFPLGNYALLVAGAEARNQQRQLNILDSISLQKGSHSLKFGIDYRRLSPIVEDRLYLQQPAFFDMASAETGNLAFYFITFGLPMNLLFRNLGAFAQDTWHVTPRLTLTYGLRWDVDFVPSSLSGPNMNAVTGFNLSNLSNLALAPAGTPPYKTKWGNIAPRIGLAYQVRQSQRWQTMLRGGFGLFYDLASSEATTGISMGLNYPFGSTKFGLGPPFGGTSTFPLSPADAAPPPIVPPNASNGTLFSVDPNLRLPYTLQWNIAIEQALGRQQTLSVSYVGAAGRRLIQTASVNQPNPNLSRAQLVTNAGTSDYRALQIQFQRRLSRGMQAIAFYALSHSLDTASAGSLTNGSNALSTLNSNANRGASDFDVRHAFSFALTYDVPTPKGNPIAKAILRGWSVQNIIQGRSAPPVDLFYGNFGRLSNGFLTNPRPDIVAGQPFYLRGPQYPGGLAFNPAAFTSPPTSGGLPTRQGNLPRNTLRGFGLAQWDFAVHRDFALRESVKLQFLAEMFNVLNHPNFGQPVGDLSNPQFGRSTQMLGQSLAGGSLGSGGFSPLYQVGGPRTVQFGLKLFF